MLKPSERIKFMKDVAGEPIRGREKIYIFGAGTGGRRAIEALSAHYTIAAIIDSDLSKSGTFLLGYPIVGISDLSLSAGQCVVIASGAVLEIAELLIDRGLSEKNIWILEESIRVGAKDVLCKRLLQRLDCCYRFDPPGFLGPLNSYYIKRRDAFFKEVFDGASGAIGSLLSTAVAKAEGARFDERLVEVFYSADVIIRKGRENAAKPSILDVGCVLNQNHISSWVERNVASIMFNNPSVEKLNGYRKASYLLGDPRVIEVTPSLKFDIVFSLSTLEHVGMNNVRYGGVREEFKGDCQEPELFAVEALRAIARFVKVGGTLVVSVPYGEFRYFYLPATGLSPVYYSFDYDKLNILCSCLVDFDIEIDVWRFDDCKGWVESEKTAGNWPEYGCDNPGAGAVAMIRATRMKDSDE